MTSPSVGPRPPREQERVAGDAFFRRLPKNNRHGSIAAVPSTPVSPQISMNPRCSPACLAALIAIIGSGCAMTPRSPTTTSRVTGARHPEMSSWFGAPPILDGVISPGEWDDATRFDGVRAWVPEFSPVLRDEDLSLAGWVKHDDHWLYFAFEVTDDTLYGIDTTR